MAPSRNDAGVGVTRDPLAIGGRPIGRDHQPFIVAEAGVNHNGDSSMAIDLVDAAAAAGADAVKFQTFRADALVTRSAALAPYQREGSLDDSQFAMLRRLELKPSTLRRAFTRARSRGIVAFSTPFDVESVHLLQSLQVPAIKIGSGDVTNLLLLRAACAVGVPIILSTGMAYIEEIGLAVAAIRAAGDPPLSILHCISAYPTPTRDSNLRAIPALRRRFRCEVGFSDHTTEATAPIAAVAFGATIIEKHLTLDRTLPGPDHAASLEPEGFAKMVAAIRDAYAALGKARDAPYPIENSNRPAARRSLVLRRRMAAGTRLSIRDLDVKRPAAGISPLRLDEVVGRRLARDVARDVPLVHSDLDPPLVVASWEHDQP